MSERAIKFSLVLCTVGRRDEIAAFCASLARQGRDDYELILVDQNTDGRLDAIVAEYATQFPLRHLKSDTRGLSRARNAGLRLATGELIGFPDDDCEYFDDFLNRVAGLFDGDAGLDGITGYPTAADTRTLPADWGESTLPLDACGVLNRCQEFTIFVRHVAMQGVRFNEALGVGAGTPWGADEGPDFLIRVIEGGARFVFYPHLFVFHPDKILTITPQTLLRAASYARGRGCLFRLHRFPLRTTVQSVIRPAGGALIYAIRLQPMRSRYYVAVLGGILRGLLMPAAEINRLRSLPRLDGREAPVDSEHRRLGKAHLHA